MRFKYLAEIVFCMSFGQALQAAANGDPYTDGHENNGGNLTVVRFTSVAREIHTHLRTRPAGQRILKDSDIARLATTIDNTRIEPVSESLTDIFGQRADATVESDDRAPSRKKIRIWEPAWRQYLVAPVSKDVYVLVFHEYLRVMGFNEDQQPVSNLLTLGTGRIPQLAPNGFNLGFEAPGASTLAIPAGWFRAGMESYQVLHDATVAHSGQSSLVISGVDQTTFGGVGQCVQADEMRGHSIKLNGYLKLMGVQGFAGLWLRIDGPFSQVLFLDNMMNRNIRGTNDWRQYSTSTIVPMNATYVCFGAVVYGGGTAWVDDLSITTDQ